MTMATAWDNRPLTALLRGLIAKCGGFSQSNELYAEQYADLVIQMIESKCWHKAMDTDFDTGFNLAKNLCLMSLIIPTTPQQPPHGGGRVEYGT